MKSETADLFASPISAGSELSKTATEINEGGEIKSVIWETSRDIRPNLPLKLRRVKVYTAEGSSKNTYSTELEMLGKVLPIAPVHDRGNAEFLIAGWVKLLDPILSKIELNGTQMTVKKIDSTETFIQSVTQTEKYKEKYKERA